MLDLIPCKGRWVHFSINLRICVGKNRLRQSMMLNEADPFGKSKPFEEEIGKKYFHVPVSVICG